MKIFVAGATGAVGRRLVPLLVAAGHHVFGTTRTRAKLNSLAGTGAEPILMDGLDRESVRAAVLSVRPDVVVQQMTALAPLLNLKKFAEALELTNRLRADGTTHLAAAALEAGAHRLLSQSYSGWPNQRIGGRVKTEEDPLDAEPPAEMAAALDAIKTLERVTVETPGLAGLALRYGSLYGPGTSIAADGVVADLVRQRKFPLVGGGAGVWSFIHVDDAARATAIAIERGSPGVYNVVDDEPAEVSAWLPYLASSLGAKPPLPLPAWMARLAVGAAGVVMMTSVRGASNAKAKRELGWQPEYGSWREGFRRGLAAPLPADHCQPAI